MKRILALSLLACTVACSQMPSSQVIFTDAAKGLCTAQSAANAAKIAALAIGDTATANDADLASQAAGAGCVWSSALAATPLLSKPAQ